MAADTENCCDPAAGMIGWQELFRLVTACSEYKEERDVNEVQPAGVQAWLGVDTGGTFTDFVLWQDQVLRTHKVLSTPADPARAILQGITDLGLMSAAASGGVCIVHGSTVATNAALEKKGVRTLFITNRGFRDMLTLARQTRSEIYNLMPRQPAPPVPQELCLEVDCRRDCHGNLLQPLTREALQALVIQAKALKPQAVAINLLYSFLEPQEEIEIEQALSSCCFVARSSYILPEYKEYERGMATWLSAWLGPLVQRYLRTLRAELPGAKISMMQSSGGTIALEQAASRTVNLLLSGPAGGLAAVQYLGKLLGERRFITFDMGGTSTDVALLDGAIRLTSEGRIGPWPVAVPMVDMHTIGAGGGSIAWLDEGGLLQVGPQSAGADPGPACYGLGGTSPTVTDANLVLGRLVPDAFLGGRLVLNVAAAREAVGALAARLALSVEATAEGIVRIANEHMIRALRSISIQKGFDPASFRLCCFGGAGGLHLCAIADALGMNKAIVPVNGGVLSALGMLVAPRQRQMSRTCLTPLSVCTRSSLLQLLEPLAQQGRNELVQEGVSREQIQVTYSLDLRYQGQSSVLSVPFDGAMDEAQVRGHLEQAFHQLHRQHYGHDLSVAVEVVNLRAAVTAPGNVLSLASVESESSPTLQVAEKGQTMISGVGLARVVRATVRPGQVLHGPLLVVETTATTLIGAGWEGRVDALGNLLLTRSSIGF